MTDIIYTLANTRELSIFANAIRTTSLDKILTADCDFTIFAPNNLAFAELSKVDLGILTNDIWRLTEIISLHIIPGIIGKRELLKNCRSGERETIVTSLDSSSIKINFQGGIKFGDAHVLSTDAAARNGIIHIIDRVLIPSLADRVA
jgi:uncharacterized surface protein with fasciclin (FAS1) repeats